MPANWRIRQPRHADFSIGLNEDGSATISDGSGRQAGTVEKPWAYDATGRSLATHYVVEGAGLVQKVDTDGATFPVIADPRITTGWWFIYPVFYVEMSWSETWKLKAAVENNWSTAPALLCAYLPNTTARIACGALWIGIRQDVINTVNAAIKAGKCYKVRLPAHGSGAAAAAYDSYYVTCKS